MKTWLRLTLVLFLVGGGFAGTASTVAALKESTNQTPFAISSFGVFLALNLLITLSGLLLVYNPEYRRLLRFAIGVQIPWISCPSLMYRFLAGMGFYLRLSSESFEGLGRITQHSAWEFYFGSTFSFGISRNDPWSLGINLVAVMLYILLPSTVRVQRASLIENSEQPTFWDTLPKPPAPQ